MEHVICWSGGADSTATIILAKENGIPIDYILFSEVMFDVKISCELPEHISFVKNIAIPKFAEWGYRTEILHHDKTYMDYFNQIRKRGKYAGMKVGFPMADRCNARNCKIKPIENFLKLHENSIQYVGICMDERKRLERLKGNKVSLLAQYGYTQLMAREKCKEYGLLSPYYQYSKRGGCWCCPNAGLNQLRFVRRNHPELWKNLISLEKEDNLIGNLYNTQAGRSIISMDEQFFLEEKQLKLFDLLKED